MIWCRLSAVLALALIAALAAAVDRPGATPFQVAAHAPIRVGWQAVPLSDAGARPGAVIRPAPLRPTQEMTHTAFLPVLEASPECPAVSANVYGTVPYEGGPYKNNRLSDENADFRLSILGYEPTSAPLTFVDYGGPADADGPRLHGIFEPNRVPDFVQAYRVYGWNWDENAPPPYGSRGPVNTNWPVTAIDFGVTPGEAIHIPARDAAIYSDGYTALVLYAGERELTAVYMRADQIVVNGSGYVVHMLGFCVDPNLLALYRAQLDATGRRATGSLPALRNGQPAGTALANPITVAIRDVGAYMDPRVERDWWRNHP